MYGSKKMTPSDRLFSLRDIGIFFYLVPFRMITYCLPTRAVRFLGLLLGNAYSALAYKRKRRVQRRLRTAFGNSTDYDDYIALSRRCIVNAVATHVDSLILDRIDTQTLLKSGKINGLEHLDNALLKGKGVVLLAGHFTGHKIACRVLHASGYPHFGVVKKRADDHNASRFENRYLSVFWSKVIERTGDAPLVDDKDVGLRIMKQLRQNGIVIILMDVPFSRYLLTRPFLGVEHSFPVGFLRIIYSTGAAVVPMWCIGDSSAFHLCFDEAVHLQEATNKDEFITRNIDMLVKVLESQIFRDPSHWLKI